MRTKSTINWEWKQLAPDEHQQLSGTGQIIKHCLDLNNLPAKRKSTPLNIIGLSQFMFTCLERGWKYYLF